MGTEIRACVFTSLFGRYEELLPQSIAAESDLELICFTDDPALKSDRWRIELVQPMFRSDPVRSSRYPKICAHRFLSAYDTSLYIDNSVLLNRPPEDIVERLLPGDGAVYGAIAHSFRETIKDEFDAVMESRLDDERVCLEQLDHYRLDYPHVLGMRPSPAGSSPGATTARRLSRRWSAGGTTCSVTRAATGCRCWLPSPTRRSRPSWRTGTCETTLTSAGPQASAGIAADGATPQSEGKTTASSKTRSTRSPGSIAGRGPTRACTRCPSGSSTRSIWSWP